MVKDWKDVAENWGHSGHRTREIGGPCCKTKGAERGLFDLMEYDGPSICLIESCGPLDDCLRSLGKGVDSDVETELIDEGITPKAKSNALSTASLVSCSDSTKGPEGTLSRGWQPTEEEEEEQRAVSSPNGAILSSITNASSR